MVLRKLTLFVVFLVAFTIFFGAGCKSKMPPQDIAGQPEQEAEATPQADAGAEGEVKPEPRADSGVSKPDASAIPEGWEVYREKEGRYEAAYPGDWQVIEHPDDPLIVDFIASDNPAASGSESLGDISIVVRENLAGFSMDQFYDGQRQANLFVDTQGGIRERDVDSIRSRVFAGVIGKITEDIAVIPLADMFLEIAFTRPDLDPALFERFLDHLQVRR